MSKLFNFARGLPAVTSNAHGGGQPIPLVIVTVIVLAMAVVTMVDTISNGAGGIDWTYENGFICRSCGYINTYSRGQLVRKMSGPPGLGPIVIDCPECNKHTHTEARICPKCNDIFEMKIENCPKCGTNYVEAKRAEFDPTYKSAPAKVPSEKINSDNHT